MTQSNDHLRWPAANFAPLETPKRCTNPECGSFISRVYGNEYSEDRTIKLRYRQYRICGNRFNTTEDLQEYARAHSMS